MRARITIELLDAPEEELNDIFDGISASLAELYSGDEVTVLGYEEDGNPKVMGIEILDPEEEAETQEDS